MEVYILDSFYRRTAVVDQFESLIWSERWNQIGDVELVVPSSPVNRTLFVPDALLALNESKRVMMVKTVEDSTDSEDRTRLKVKGVSLEKVLDDRPARPSTANLTDMPKWKITNTPANVALAMFSTVCVNGAVNANDTIPLLVEGTTYPTETIPLPSMLIAWEQDPDTLLNAIMRVCQLFKLGFRLCRNGDQKQLFFDVYTGNDRTTKQRVLKPVVFAKNLESIQNTSQFVTVTNVKNVAYVMNEQGFQAVYGNGVPAAITGAERRTMIVKPAKLMFKDANNADVNPTPEELSAYFTIEGLSALSEKTAMFAFDGEVNERSPYRYGVDYELGDLVEMRDEEGVPRDMRVTEQIFVSDTQGERSYPSLVIDDLGTFGSWTSYLNNRQWADFGATEYWSTQL